MAQILPYCAILCHFQAFCKENLYLTRQPLLFHHFARPWPLTSRRAEDTAKRTLCTEKRKSGPLATISRRVRNPPVPCLW